MFTILLHSSKTMRQPIVKQTSYQRPSLLVQAEQLASYVKLLTPAQLETSMKISPAMAVKTRELWQAWNVTPTNQLPAIDAFLGDIYSGLQVQKLSTTDRAYANKHLYILSGLYGVLRALDGISPYRLEMGYHLPDEPYKNLYKFWSDRLARVLPGGTVLVNLSAVEYTKTVLPYLTNRSVVSPKFMTIDSKTKQPKFVTVHAKIARGAFAHWLITNRIETINELQSFHELGYHYRPALSTPDQPVFVCETFGGLGLSVRLH